MTIVKRLKACSIDDLDDLAVELHERYRKVELQLTIDHEPPSEADIHRINEQPSLRDVLQERQRRLNREFRFTPETLACFVALSDRFGACMKNAWLEAKPEMEALERRLQNHDPFLKDYELDWKLQAFTGQEGIYAVLEDTAHSSMAIHARNAKSYENCGIREMDCDESWTECFPGHEEISTQRISLAMHELYDHSFWSVPDILKIETIWVDVVIRRQYLEQTKPIYSAWPNGHQP